MKLLTKELLSRFAKVGSQELSKDPIVIAKFFNPTGVGTWYALEYNPEDKVFFGYVNLGDEQNAELEYFSLEELENYVGTFGLGIERDLYFTEKPLSVIRG